MTSLASTIGLPTFLFTHRSTDHPMRERFETWLLISAHRYLIATGILAVMTGIVLIPDVARDTIQNITPLFYFTSALIGGNITLVTVVVAINQVILSQELESPGSIRDEIERTADYRQETLDQPSPPTDPADFVQQLLQKTHDDAASLETLLSEADGTNDRFLSELAEQCERCRNQIDSSSNTMSSVIAPLLGVDYADYIHDCYRLQSNHEDEADEELLGVLDILTSDLENLDIARQYFTTAFMKEELAMLSRLLVYIAVVAVAMPIALLYELMTYSGASPPMPRLFIFSVLTVVVGLLPLAMLIAYVIRIATVTQYIAAITPFRA